VYVYVSLSYPALWLQEPNKQLLLILKLPEQQDPTIEQFANYCLLIASIDSVSCLTVIARRWNKPPPLSVRTTPYRGLWQQNGIFSRRRRSGKNRNGGI